MNTLEEVKIYDNNTIETTPADINFNNVKNIIRKKENPHPLIITFMTLLILILIYCIYILFIKKNISGTWIPRNQKIKIKINHNPFTDSVTINFNDTDKLIGKVYGKAIDLKTNKMGLITDNNEILLFHHRADDDNIWVNEKNII